MATRRRKRSRKGKMPAGLKAYWAKKRAGSNPPKRRKRRASKRRATVSMNAPRRAKRSRSSAPRRSSRRSYRRNPGLPTSGFVMDAVYVTGGFFATRFAAGFVLPMLPMTEQPIVRIAAKGAVAWGLGFLGGKFLGQRSGQLLMLGGLVEALGDAVKTYVSPYVPALADDNMNTMGSYPSLMSYPMGDGYSNPYHVGESEYDEV